MSSSSSTNVNATSPPLIYACVARSTTVLSSASFPVRAEQLPQSLISHAVQLTGLILPKIPHVTSSKLTYTYNDLFLSYIAKPSSLDIPGGLSFVAISPSSAGRKVPFAFLMAVQKAFEEMYTAEEIGTMHEGGAKDQFDEVIQREMGRYSAGIGSTPGTYGDITYSERDNLKKVREEIDNVRGIMTENIERVLERGERIDLLVDKTGRLNVEANEFRRRSRGLRRKMWWKNVKLMALLVFVVIFLLYLFVGFGCGLPSWQKCFGK